MFPSRGSTPASKYRTIQEKYVTSAISVDPSGHEGTATSTATYSHTDIFALSQDTQEIAGSVANADTQKHAYNTGRCQKRFAFALTLEYSYMVVLILRIGEVAVVC